MDISKAVTSHLRNFSTFHEDLNKYVKLSFASFNYLSKYSNISFDFMLIFLVIHIFIAIAAIAGWIFLFISSFKQYKRNELNGLKHKKIGKGIFAALTLTSIMGTCMYLFLFVF